MTVLEQVLMAILTAIASNQDSIGKLIGLFEGVKSGTINPSDVLNEIPAMQGQVTADNTAADQAVDAKFPK